MKVFSVYDSKGECYAEPFIQKTVGEAKRGFALATENEKSKIGKWPEDHTLFELGEWDERTGVFTPHKAQISHGLALQYVKKGDNQVTLDEAIREAKEKVREMNAQH